MWFLRLLNTLLFLIATAYIALAGFSPAPPSFIGANDKWVHAFTFLLLPLLGSSTFKQVKSHYYWIGWAAVAAFSEILQGSQLIHRKFELGDLLANFTGVALAFALWFCFRAILKPSACPGEL